MHGALTPSNSSKNLWKSFNPQLDGIHLLPSPNEINKFYGVCFLRDADADTVEFVLDVVGEGINVNFYIDELNSEFKVFMETRELVDPKQSSSLLNALLSIASFLKFNQKFEPSGRTQIFADLLAEVSFRRLVTKNRT